MRAADDNQALVAFHFGRFIGLFLVCGLRPSTAEPRIFDLM
jgi:hypothetical protein